MNGECPVNVCSRLRNTHQTALIFARTSTATIEKVKTSPSSVTAPPLNISGAAHVVVPATRGS